MYQKPIDPYKPAVSPRMKRINSIACAFAAAAIIGAYFVISSANESDMNRAIDPNAGAETKADTKNALIADAHNKLNQFSKQPKLEQTRAASSRKMIEDFSQGKAFHGAEAIISIGVADTINPNKSFTNIVSRVTAVSQVGSNGLVRTKIIFPKDSKLETLLEHLKPEEQEQLKWAMMITAWTQDYKYSPDPASRRISEALLSIFANKEKRSSRFKHEIKAPSLTLGNKDEPEYIQLDFNAPVSLPPPPK